MVFILLLPCAIQSTLASFWTNTHPFFTLSQEWITWCLKPGFIHLSPICQNHLHSQPFPSKIFLYHPSPIQMHKWWVMIIATICQNMLCARECTQGFPLLISKLVPQALLLTPTGFPMSVSHIPRDRKYQNAFRVQFKSNPIIDQKYAATLSTQVANSCIIDPNQLEHIKLSKERMCHKNYRI